jgi:DNA-binding response OmpR family regulator
MERNPPDVLLLGPEWPERALLRAQLIEEGFDVVAIDEWPIPRLYRRPGMKPRVVIIDLQGLPEPRNVLDELRFVIRPDRVLVVTALGTLAVDKIRQLGYHVVTRPTSGREVVAAAAGLLRESGPPQQGGSKHHTAP